MRRAVTPGAWLYGLCMLERLHNAQLRPSMPCSYDTTICQPCGNHVGKSTQDLLTNQAEPLLMISLMI